MPKLISEQATLTESVDKKSGKILVDILTPGVGSSGYYSPQVVEAAAGLVQPGTKMFIDHPTDLEAMERPIRSVKDIAAVFTEEARWDPARGEAGSLVAEAQVVPTWVETMEVIQGAIGTSIRGSATDIVEGVRPDGTRGRIVEGLHAIDSVDFVTAAGRGGSFALMESASPSRVHARAMGHGISEATVNDTREALQTVLKDTYGADKTYVWVRDFDETTVWFEVEAPENTGIFAQAYAMSDTAGASLSGDRTEVQVKTQYMPVTAASESATTTSVPVTRPDSTNPTTEADQEVTMGNIQIEESEHRALVEKAGRVDALESERDTAVQERDQLREEKTQRDRVDAARKIITERATAADMLFTPLEERGLLADLPLKENALDVEAFTKTVDEAAATRKAGSGAGTVTGFGGSSAGGETTLTEAQLDAKVGAAFGRTPTVVKEA